MNDSSFSISGLSFSSACSGAPSPLGLGIACPIPAAKIKRKGTKMTKREKRIVENIFACLQEGLEGSARGYAALLGLKVPEKEKDGEKEKKA